MDTAGRQSDVLQRLGVSYSQLLDYSSKEYVNTLVSPTDGPADSSLSSD